jgi:hypothetical protein
MGASIGSSQPLVVLSAMVGVEIRANTVGYMATDCLRSPQFIDTVDIHRRRVFAYDRPVLH